MKLLWCYLVQCDTLGGCQKLAVQLCPWSRFPSSTLEELRSAVGGTEQNQQEAAVLREHSGTGEEDGESGTTADCPSGQHGS